MVNSGMTTIFIGCSLMVPMNNFFFFLFTPPPYTCIPVPSTFIDNGKPLSVVSVCRCVELCLGQRYNVRQVAYCRVRTMERYFA